MCSLLETNANSQSTAELLSRGWPWRRDPHFVAQKKSNRKTIFLPYEDLLEG